MPFPLDPGEDVSCQVTVQQECYCPSLSESLIKSSLCPTTQYKQIYLFPPIFSIVFESSDQLVGIETLNGSSSRHPTFHGWGNNVKPIVLFVFLYYYFKVTILSDKMTFDSSFYFFLLSRYFSGCFFSIFVYSFFSA